MATSLEREVKLRFDSAEAARAAALAVGATPLRCRRLQEDALLDNADESLRQRRCVLRVRVESGKSLLTFKGPVQPSPVKAREEIETVVSHPMALAQCGEVLERLGAEQEPAANTAVAARLLAESGDRKRAAIASEAAAVANRLAILCRNVHDRPDNATTFCIVEVRS